MIYEIHYPPNGSSGKSWAYAYDLSTDEGTKSFWDSQGGRNKIQLYSVNVPDIDATQQFFDDHTGTSWPYDLMSNNCKNYVMDGFTSGGANLPNQSPFPSQWPYGNSVGWLLPGTSTPQQVEPWHHKW